MHDSDDAEGDTGSLTIPHSEPPRGSTCYDAHGCSDVVAAPESALFRRA